MELRHLRYFIAVADELNFTRAAKALHLSQPSLTRQIQSLEDELGVRLLERTKRLTSLTDEGRSFLVDARRLVALSLESMKSVRRFQGGEPRQLNVGYLFKFNFDLLPVTLTTLYQAFPDVTVNLFDMAPAEQILALENRKIDLGFVGLRPGSGDPNRASLAWECVARHDAVVVLPADHPLTKKSRVAIKDLQRLFFVALSEETHPGSRDWLSEVCRGAGFKPRILQDVELEAGMMTFVAEGLGVTLAREQIKKLPHPGVVFRPLTTAVKVDYWIAWRRENCLPVLERYIDIVKAVAPTWH